MPNFTVDRHISAPIERVWGVLNDFGNIADWSPGVKRSDLTSSGPVGEGSTRHCDFTPIGGVNESIGTYIPQQRMTVNLYDTSKLPISEAVADFNIASDESGTKLTIHYSYTPNRLGRVAKGTTDKQMQKGIGGLADDLKKESERVAEL